MKTCYVTSDLHVGGGDSHDEFCWDDLFANWLQKISGPDSTLVLNGDTFVFDKIPPLEVDPDLPSYLLWGVERSMEKLEAAIAAHPGFFEGLRLFIASGAEVRFTIGNHDLDLVWPEVQQRISEKIDPGDTGRISFHNVGTVFANSWIQHGHQFEPFNATDDPEHFIHVGPDGNEYLERIWGIDFVLSFFNQLAGELPFAENIKPTSYVLWHGLKEGWLGWRHFVRAIAFFARAGVPLKAVTEVVLSDAEKNQELPLDTLDLLFADKAVSAAVAEVLRTRGAPTREEVEGSLDPELIHNLIAGEDVTITAAEVGLANPAAGTGEPVLGLLRGKANIRAARKRIAAGYDHVVFGHSHHIVDGAEIEPGKRLYNPGTWIPFLNLNDPNVMAELKQGGLKKSLLQRDAAHNYETAIRAVCIRDDGSDPFIQNLDPS